MSSLTNVAPFVAILQAADLGKSDQYLGAAKRLEMDALCVPLTVYFQPSAVRLLDSSLSSGVAIILPNLNVESENLSVLLRTGRGLDVSGVKSWGVVASDALDGYAEMVGNFRVSGFPLSEPSGSLVPVVEYSTDFSSSVDGYDVSSPGGFAVLGRYLDSTNSYLSNYGVASFGPTHFNVSVSPLLLAKVTALEDLEKLAEKSRNNIRVSINSANYSIKRVTTLVSDALSVANQALKLAFGTDDISEQEKYLQIAYDALDAADEAASMLSSLERARNRFADTEIERQNALDEARQALNNQRSIISAQIEKVQDRKLAFAVARKATSVRYSIDRLEASLERPEPTETAALEGVAREEEEVRVVLNENQQTPSAGNQETAPFSEKTNTVSPCDSTIQSCLPPSNDSGNEQNSNDSLFESIEDSNNQASLGSFLSGFFRASPTVEFAQLLVKSKIHKSAIGTAGTGIKVFGTASQIAEFQVALFNLSGVLRKRNRVVVDSYISSSSTPQSVIKQIISEGPHLSRTDNFSFRGLFDKSAREDRIDNGSFIEVLVWSVFYEKGLITLIER